MYTRVVTRRFGVLAAAPILLYAVPASAHMVSTGIGPFYDGFSHILATPLDLLCLLGCALLSGLAGVKRARHAVIAGAVGWCAGVPLGIFLLDAPLETTPVLAGLLILLGGMAALDQRWWVPALPHLAFAVHALIAVNAGAGLLDTRHAFQITLGMLAGVLILLTVVTAFVTARPDTWQRIALRAAGSWMAAIGCFALAWTLRGG